MRSSAIGSVKDSLEEADFAYTTVPGKVRPLLEKIRGIGIPPKASESWLKSIGFTSSNDRSLLGMLKAVSLVDGSSIPTSTWSAFRGANHRETLGQAIRTGYAELFAVYPDAWQRPNNDLEHVFATSTSAGKQVISKTVASFKALCECADFSNDPEFGARAMHTASPLHTPIAPARGSSAPASTPSANPSIHIDLQIHVSPEATSEQIDQIFKSMAKHLYGVRDV